MTSNEITRGLLLAINGRYQPRCLVFRLNVIVARARRAGSRAACIRSAPDGTADILGTVTGFPVAIEVKAGKDRLSAAQTAFREAWKRAGGIHLVARDVDHTMTALAEELHS